MILLVVLHLTVAAAKQSTASITMVLTARILIIRMVMIMLIAMLVAIAMVIVTVTVQPPAIAAFIKRAAIPLHLALQHLLMQKEIIPLVMPLPILQAHLSLSIKAKATLAF